MDGQRRKLRQSSPPDYFSRAHLMFPPYTTLDYMTTSPHQHLPHFGNFGSQFQPRRSSYLERVQTDQRFQRRYFSKSPLQKENLLFSSRYSSRSPGKLYYQPVHKSPKNISRKDTPLTRETTFQENSGMENDDIIRKEGNQFMKIQENNIDPEKLDVKMETSFEELSQPTIVMSKTRKSHTEQQLLNYTKMIRESKESKFKKIKETIELSKRLFPSPPFE